MDTSYFPASKCAKLKVQTINFKQEVSAMNVTLLSLDLAKNIFQVCGVNQAGTAVFNKAVKRDRLRALVAQYPGVPLVMEACGGSNAWGRAFMAAGHAVKLIPPQYVKPFVKGNKNDRNDAFAISEAARRPAMRFVTPRSLEQSDMLMLHRVRERLVKARTTLVNQIRGLLSEYGEVVKPGIEQLRSSLPLLLEDASNGLTVRARHLFQQQLEEWRELDVRLKGIDKTIGQECKAHAGSARLLAVKGIGEITATALVAHLGNGAGYRNGRHYAASVGLTPREHSSGGRQKLGGISRQGNGYIRHCLIQCGWSILRHADTSADRLSCWARELAARRGSHKAAIAVANKLARLAWALLYKERDYCANPVLSLA